jgi:glycosyltransferase involved in cell wall biosynthesis
MRVLYVNPFAQLISGADESLLDLITALVPLGVEPHVVLATGSPLLRRYEAAGARVHEAPLSALKRSVNPMVAARYGFQLSCGTAAVVRVARRIKPDLVHTNMETVLDGALAARFLGIPHVLHYRGNTRDEPRIVFDVLTKLWTGLSDRVICISAGTAAIFRKRGYTDKVEPMYDPVPIDRYRRAERVAAVRAELGVASDDLLVGTVARIHPRKDLLTFVAACSRVASRLPRSRFVIVGGAHDAIENAYEAELRRTVHERGIGDRFVFAGPRFDMPAVMRSLDVFVLCSRHEGFGRVVAEAMASDVPCVLSNEGALVELSLDGRAGMLVPAADFEAFASAIVTVISDDALRERLVREGSRRVEAFEPSRVAAAVLDRYRRALAQR